MLSDLFDMILSTLESIGWRKIATWTFVVFLFWRILSVFMLYSLRPRAMKIEGKTLIFGKWLSELDFIIKGADRLVEHAGKLGKRLYAIPALSCYQILVAKHEHITEMARAGEDVMSFRAAMNERLFFKHTMFGFELNDVDPHDAIPRRVAKIYVRENLHRLSGIMMRRVEEVFSRFQPKGEKTGEAVKVPAFDLSKMLIARMNNQLLFGDELAESDEFEKNSIQYAWHTIIIMQILRQIPSIMVPIVAKTFLYWTGSMHRIGSQVRNLVRKRLENRQQGPEKPYLDGTEWVIQSSTTPAQLAPTRIIQQMVALLFASMHQMQMACTWAIVDLCEQKHLIPALREEIRTVFSDPNVKDPYDRLYFMDSFLRESSRLNPLDGLTVQRKALKGFTFSDGSYVPAGNLVAVPQRVVMSDPDRYSHPTSFDPYRYMASKDNPEAATTKYTDVNWNYTFWGSPRKSCPGRWYASYALKHVLVYILNNFDIELATPDMKKYLIWTTAIVPRSDMDIMLRKRSVLGAERP